MKDFPISSLPPAASTGNPFREAREKLEQAETLRQQHKYDRAEAICSALLRRHPDYFGALHTLGLTYADRGHPARAVSPLFRAAMLNPRSWKTLTALSGICLSLDAREMAAQILEQARAINPHDAGVLVTLGEIYREEREYELGRDAFRAAISQDPSLETSSLGVCACLMALGDYAEAADVLHGLIQRGHRSVGLLTILVQLPPTLIKVDLLAELAKMTKADSANPSEFDTTSNFIRAAALDKAGRYNEAWDVLRVANRNRAASLAKELKEMRQGEEFSLKQLRDTLRTTGPGLKGDQAISLFIMGPSRSGKTSLESLVAKLDGVKRGYENPSLESAVTRSFQEAGLLTGWSLEQLPPQFYPQCREFYLEELAKRAGSARVFTNTIPLNIHQAARLAKHIPNARFIGVKRDVDDLMLRIYMRQYRTANAYAYSLQWIRDHIRWYHEMIDLMAEKFPDIVRVIRYEDMVSEPMQALRTVSDLCDLQMLDRAVPAVGDDRGCANPYRELMASEFKS